MKDASVPIEPALLEAFTDEFRGGVKVHSTEELISLPHVLGGDKVLMSVTAVYATEDDRVFSTGFQLTHDGNPLPDDVQRIVLMEAKKNIETALRKVGS